jgi:hypothetical protein
MSEERPGLHAIPGGWEDQVLRRRRFEAAHPEVRIIVVGRAYQGIIPREHGEDVVTRYRLRDLLDELERRLTPREGDAE